VSRNGGFERISGYSEDGNFLASFRVADHRLNSLSLPVFAAARSSMAHSISRFAAGYFLRVESGTVKGIAVVKAARSSQGLPL
jgi:hypothetical protein